MKNPLVAAAALGLASTSFAATINFTDNFDGYADQTAFDAVWAPAGTATTLQSATLTSVRSVSAPNSVSTPVNTTATSTATQGRSRYTMGEIGNIATTEALTWSFDFYDSATGNPQRNFVNLQDSTAPGGNNQLVSMGLNNNQISTDSGGNYYMARILGYTPAATDPDGGAGETGTLGSGAYFKLNDKGVGLRSVGWHNLKVVITVSTSGTAQDYAFYVDNQLAETVSGVSTLRSYDNIIIGSGLTNGGVGANYDNMSLIAAPVPEPTMIAAVGFAVTGLLARRRRV